MEKKILVTGGAGYCGARVVPKLLNEGYQVIVYDIMYYGYNHLPLDHPNLVVVEGDIRDVQTFKKNLEGVNIVLHLACISNDNSFELDEKLSTSINLDAFEPMVVAAKELGCERFIYASSSSVYGVSEAPEVFEDHPLVPLTLYNKYKGMCEPILFKHTDDDFVGVIFRPATVCGYSERQRMDLSVNILTNLAIRNGNITVFGGEQLRPNLHIEDYADLCLHLVKSPNDKVKDQIFNCGYQNMSIMEIAKTVRKVVGEEFPEKDEITIERTESDDKRSYHINSDKITKVLGFKPRFTIEKAIRDICEAFKSGKLENSLEDDNYFNVRKMKRINAV